jgi:hypothetical protein
MAPSSSHRRRRLIARAVTVLVASMVGALGVNVSAAQALAPPVITSINTSSGPTAGGTTEVIHGTGFGGVTNVKFGGVAVGVIMESAGNRISVQSPAHAAGTVDIVVTAAGDSATSPADQFTYLAAPTVAGINPSAGPTSGGTAVTIAGTGFTTSSVINFGGSASSGVTVTSSTSITATAPAGSSGTVDVTVSTGGGTSATGAADHFTYTAPPTVSGVSPSAGPTAGGTSVTVTGTGFTGATAVDFGSAPASFTVTSDTSLTATDPAGAAGTVNVTVTNATGTSATSSTDQFSYLAPPSVTSISPSAGPLGGGTSVTITGTHFAAATSVAFGASTASGFTVISDTQIDATSPAGTGLEGVTVTSPGGTSAPINFDFVAAPTITEVAPDAGPLLGGTTTTITGTGFTDAFALDFGGVAASGFTVISSTEITAVAPAGAGTVDVSVTTPGGTSATNVSDEFSYLAAPTVTGLTPASGPTGGGTTVTVTGTGFTTATAVEIGGTSASFVVVGDTELVVITPASGPGAIDLTVASGGGTSATSLADEFSYVGPPTITSLSPTSGITTGGTAVTITGTGFTTATDVNFGAASAATFVVVSNTEITGTTPGGLGTVDATVTNAGGTSATSAADQFTYVAPPTIGSLSPSSGPAAGGTAVSITGTGFGPAATVDFGTTAATAVVFGSSTLLVAVAPAGSGVADVTVTMPVATSATSANDQFTFVAPSGPAITSVTPPNGAVTGGTVVTITGTGFTGATSVTFGQVAAASFTVDSDTQITATTPPGTTGVSSVVVTTLAGSSVAASFRYDPSSAPVAPILGETGSSSPLPGLLTAILLVLIGGFLALVPRRSLRAGAAASGPTQGGAGYSSMPSSQRPSTGSDR